MKIDIVGRLLLVYCRYFPVRAGKYRMVERFGRGKEGNFIRLSKLKYGDFYMLCDLRKLLQRHFYYFGTYFSEERVLSYWTQYAEKARVVFDIGANAGIYSLAAAASNPLAEIHAFEPTREIVAHFEETVSRNHLSERVHIHPCAVARSTGSAYLNFCSGEHNDNEGMNFVTGTGLNLASVAIPTISLDDFCAEHGISEVDLVKIDVQGLEPEVLAGAEKLIRRKALRTIFFELNWNHDDLAHCPATNAVKMLADFGYQFADPNDCLKFQDAGPWLHALSDVVASVDMAS